MTIDLLRITIWIAMIGYGTATVLLLLQRRNQHETLAANPLGIDVSDQAGTTSTNGDPIRWLLDSYAAKLIWSLGCVVYLVHVLIAFHQHYQWSHFVAVDLTAVQAFEQTGIRTRSGIYFNYLFTLVWVIDCSAWWWLGTQRYRSRPLLIHLGLHCFFLFMIFNGAVVFATGISRWIGIVVVTAVVLTALAKIRTQLRL